MAIKQAANRPAPADHSSLVRKYVEIAVRPLKIEKQINENETYFHFNDCEFYTPTEIGIQKIQKKNGNTSNKSRNREQKAYSIKRE